MGDETVQNLIYFRPEKEKNSIIKCPFYCLLILIALYVVLHLCVFFFSRANEDKNSFWFSTTFQMSTLNIDFKTFHIDVIFVLI